MTSSDRETDFHALPEPEKFRRAVAGANIPTLLLMLVQMTGDFGWLEPPYCPGRARGLDDNDSGGLPQPVQDTIRTAALEAILAWRNGRPLALPEPDEAAIVHMLGVATGEAVPPTYGAMVAADLRTGVQDEPPVRPSVPPPADFRVVVIGAGISGLCASYYLQQAGIEHVILEKNDNVGGTWYENRYPGAGVDTPNHLYSFSFAKRDWERYFALRGEIEAYLEQVAADFGINERTRFGCTVLATEYDETSRQWLTRYTDAEGGEQSLWSNAVISAVGALNVPKVPPIPGLDGFSGRAFHTARWPEDLDVTGQRVAVVGNGASAMQVVPAIADRVESLDIFQRSKQWVAPFDKFQQPVPEPIRFLLREVPLYQAWYRIKLAWSFNDRIHESLQKDPEWSQCKRSVNATNDVHRELFVRYIREELGERQDLLPEVLPDYPPFGKRMLLDNGWYRAIAKPNVNLFTDAVASIEGSTVETRSGRRRDVDVLVLATGFDAVRFLGSYEVRGRDGVTLREVWGEDNAQAYLGVAVPGFPNLFTLLGPNTGLGHGGSVISIIETQMRYVTEALQTLVEQDLDAVEVREDVHRAYNQKVDAAHENMVWTHEGMDNWYRNSRGRVVVITPFRHDDYWHMMREVRIDDYWTYPPRRQQTGGSNAG
ncbi:flavin-containing monooxygenase [Aquisalimonas sp. APHAB1-3]|uniref:flavin-containing monooxygenase n=1 Tax=Aquisalimonas sp. APHAB1-3 TaxID=3402080 RepID=UPI003AAE1381